MYVFASVTSINCTCNNQNVNVFLIFVQLYKLCTNISVFRSICHDNYDGNLRWLWICIHSCIYRYACLTKAKNEERFYYVFVQDLFFYQKTFVDDSDCGSILCGIDIMLTYYVPCHSRVFYMTVSWWLCGTHRNFVCCSCRKKDEYPRFTKQAFQMMPTYL